MVPPDTHISTGERVATRKTSPCLRCTPRTEWPSRPTHSQPPTWSMATVAQTGHDLCGEDIVSENNPDNWLYLVHRSTRFAVPRSPDWVKSHHLV